MISWWSITCLIPALLLISARIYGFLVSLPPTGAGWTREPPLWDNNWHKIEELCLLVTDHPSPKPPCEMSEPHYLWSPPNCWWCRCWWRGRGPGWVQGYDVLMSSVIFLYTGVIHHVTSQPSSTQLCHAVLWSGKTRWHKDSPVSGCSGCSCVMSSFSTTSPRDTIENIRHFLSDETRLILSAQTFYKNTHFYCWKMRSILKYKYIAIVFSSALISRIL